jgi:hypothetical protein
MALTAADAARLFPTDKISYHGYFPAYREIAARLGPAGRVCEIGVEGGASLKMWQALFPAGLVAGVDIRPGATWPEGTVKVVSGQDAGDLPARLREVSPGGFDLIVDDASHDGALTRRTWELLWPLVRPGGCYVIEDWDVALSGGKWKSYGNSMLRTAESFLPLLDRPGCDPDSIEYRNGLIILRRKPRPVILCCYTDLHPATRRALERHAPDAELVDVSGDDTAYWAAIAERWTGERDLVIVEQDNEITADVIPSFMACGEPWCTYSYPIYRTKVTLRQGLGCTKISAEAQRLAPAAEIAEWFTQCDYCHGGGCWWHLDGRIAEVFRKGHHLDPHVHGEVTHHHAYDADPEAVEVAGRPMEWFFEDAEDAPPAVELGPDRLDRHLLAVTGNQAKQVAQSLAELAAAHGITSWEHVA